MLATSPALRAERPRSWSWQWIAALGVAVLLWLPRLGGPIDIRFDAPVYYVLGSSLAAGNGYRIESEPGAPQGVQYPPGLPLFIAGFQVLLQSSDPSVVGPWLRWAYAGLTVAYALLIFAYARRHLGPNWSLLAVVLCLLQQKMLMASEWLMTELPFALTCVAFALFCRGRREPRPGLRREALGFALVSIGFSLKTAGIALLAAWCLEAAVRRQWRTAVIRGLLSLIPFGLWQGYVARVKASEEYHTPTYAYQRAPYLFNNVTYAENIALIDPFVPELGNVTPAVVLRRGLTNLRKMPVAIGEMVSESAGFWRWFPDFLPQFLRPIFTERVRYVGLVSLGLLVTLGMVTLARRGESATVFLVIISIALICSTPWPTQFERYLLAIGGILAVGGALGFEQAYAFFARRRNWIAWLGRAYLAVLLLTALSMQALAVTMAFKVRQETAPAQMPKAENRVRLFYYEREWIDWAAAVDWVNAHARRDAIIATDTPHILYLRTGLLSVCAPFEIDPRRASKLLQAVPVTHVILDERKMWDLGVRYTLPALESEPERWRKVYSFGGAHVYELIALPPRNAE